MTAIKTAVLGAIPGGVDIEKHISFWIFIFRNARHCSHWKIQALQYSMILDFVSRQVKPKSLLESQEKFIPV